MGIKAQPPPVDSLEPAAGVTVMSRPLNKWGQDSADLSLHTAGQNNPDRLDLLGPAAIGSGPGQSKESDADQSGMERVEGCGYCEPNRAGLGRSGCTVVGEWRNSQPCPMLLLGYRIASRLPLIRKALRV
jgi:hypothetical protein